MQYSPKLKKAMREIETILKAHDIAGSVVLHTPGYSEYLLHVFASYSCMTIDPVKGHIRTGARLKEDFNGDKIAWHKKINETVNMVVHFRDVSAKQHEIFNHLAKQLKKHVDIIEDNGEHTDNVSQNN